VVAITSQVSRASIKGNVFLPAAVTNLPKDSAAAVTSIATLDKGDLETLVGTLPAYMMTEVDAGLRRALDL
jgi:mRNA interferase MazF